METRKRNEGMKRLHINLQVRDLEEARAHYSTLLGSEPGFEKQDYARWELDEPALSLSITDRAGASGLDHLGIKFDAADELHAARQRLEAVGAELRWQENASCCYAKSDKGWWRDPAGLNWELFITHRQVEEFGGDGVPPDTGSADGSDRSVACC